MLTKCLKMMKAARKRLLVAGSSSEGESYTVLTIFMKWQPIQLLA